VKIQAIDKRILQLAICLGLGFAPSAFCQEPSQPSKVEPNQQPQEQQEQKSTNRIQLSDKEMKKLIFKKVKPEYSDIARQARIVGKCGVRVVITPQGDLGEVRLNYGHPILAPSAIRAVKQWKFRPYLLDGHPVEVEGEVEVNVP
jgi:protein TonB